MVKIFSRVFWLIILIIMVLLFTTPFIIMFLIFGINQANIFMSTIMKVPMNELTGDNLGDTLLDIHKEIKETEKNN